RPKRLRERTVLSGKRLGSKEVSVAEVLPMIRALQVDTTVLPGHRIEVSSPELPEGRSATVLILLKEEDMPKLPLRERLGDYPGGRLFKSAEEVDAYLREERDSWDRPLLGRDADGF